MKKFRFLEWQVYKDAKKVFAKVMFLVKKMPQEYRYDIGSQITRSSLSIALNLAEGSGKHSDKDMNHFFNIALGSLNETVACLDILKDIKLISDREFSEFFLRLSSINDQLGGFKKSLKGKVISHES